MAECPRCRAAFERAMATNRRVRAWLGDLCVATDGRDLDIRLALHRVLWRVSTAGVETRRSGCGVRSQALAASFVVQGLLVAVLMTMGVTQTAVGRRSHVVLTEPRPVVRHIVATAGHGDGGGKTAIAPVTSATSAVPRAVKTFAASLLPTRSSAPSLSLPDSPDALLGTSGVALGTFGFGPGPGQGGVGYGTNGTGSGGDLGSGSEIGVYSTGNGITAPSVISRVDPEYSEEARKAKYSGSVMLSIIVGLDGRAESIRVVKSLGMGLDEKAIEAVREWLFKPGTNHGAAVRVRAQVEVNFRLL